jgi:hypothetical protein
MDNDSAEIRAAVQMAVVEVCAGGHHTTRLSPQAIATVAELTIQFVRCSLVPNLQAFSTHAARRRITEQDVLLTVRNHREFHRKIQQKVEHFKRTRDILGAPDVAANSRRNQAQPDQIADEDEPSSSNSSGSSTASESPEPAAKQLPATKRSDRPRFDDLSSSDDDELNAMRAKLVRKKPKRAVVPATANPTTKEPKPAGPRRATFRLGGADADLAASTLDSPDSSSSPLPTASGTLQTQSRRLQEILLKNQDEESLPSECD